MTSQSWRGAFVPVLVLGVALVGCAKRPATTQASSPAPTGTSAVGQPGSTGTRVVSTQTGGATSTTGGMASQPSGTPTAPGGTGATTGTDSRGTPTTVQGGTPGTTGGTTAGTTGAVTSPGGTTIAGSSTTPGSTATTPTTTTPTPPRPGLREFAEIAALQDIHFEFDQSTILPEAAKTLDANASWMKSNPNHLILIEGHCDERGTNDYNLALGERRARSTMNYLVAQGVQASRITIISYGEERPTCNEKTEACWAKNRRAHFLAKAR